MSEGVRNEGEVQISDEDAIFWFSRPSIEGQSSKLKAHLTVLIELRVRPAMFPRAVYSELRITLSRLGRFGSGLSRLGVLEIRYTSMYCR